MKKLDMIHNNVSLTGGSFQDELPEQIMSCTYIKPENVVLEIGGNIGRNSLVIGTLLSNSENLVVLECDPDAFIHLEKNRTTNDLKFNSVNAAISSRKLIQSGWTSIQSDVILPGYFPITTMPYEDFKEDHGLMFDTLVADCEGALYYILLDYPELLEGITTVIMENDYQTIAMYDYVRKILLERQFKLVHTQALRDTPLPCKDFFYQVWQIL